MWNRGIVFANDCVRQSTFQDLGSSQHKSIDIRGSPTFGIYQSSSKTKNLFAGNTTVNGELRLGGRVVKTNIDGTEHSVIMGNGKSEEYTNGGVVVLNSDGTAVVVVGSHLCQNSKDFHHSYQLTAHGRPMPNLFVAAELHWNERDECVFSIAGGGSGAGKVSWRVHSAIQLYG